MADPRVTQIPVEVITYEAAAPIAVTQVVIEMIGQHLFQAEELPIDIFVTT